MSERHRGQWEKLGAKDPYWAVISNPAMKHGKWDTNAFFESGEHEIQALRAVLAELGIYPNTSQALDFGCGVGRLSRALAGHFDSVVAVDLSSTMLAEARSANAHVHRIEFVHNTASDLAFLASDSTDLVYSNIVLQHISSKGQLSYIRDFCRILRPGGTLVFQTPSHADLRSLRGWAYLLLPLGIQNLLRRVLHGRDGVMEIHTLPREKVSELLESQGMRMIDIRPSGATGPGFHAFTYYCVRE